MHSNKSYNTDKEPDLAVLVGVNCKEADLDELASLCDNCNIHEVARTVQIRKDVDVTYYIGRGKVDEIKGLVTKHRANVVVFDVELSGSKVRNLEEVLNVPVLDRSKIILDIFAARAQSMEGKLQVELAQLKYNLPRLRRTSGDTNNNQEIMSKMKSSVGMRGPGEKKLELDKRTIRDQIAALETKIAQISANRDVNRKQAFKSSKSRVCIVGYTNSGKSTLLNTIAKAGVIAEDKLFATLDPKTVNVYIDGRQILLTDTVGFIDKLPHEFIHAFESTLDEARFADLLLHVADISNPTFKQQIDIVKQVLKEIGADKVPVIMVYNKSDAVNESSASDIDIKNGVIISARKNHGIAELKQKILDFLGKITLENL